MRTSIDLHILHLRRDYIIFNMTTHTSEPQAGTDLLLTDGGQLESLHQFSNQNNDPFSSKLQR